MKQKTSNTVERLDLEKTEDKAQLFLHKQRFDFTLKRLSGADSVLEIGIGTGYFSEVLARHCRSYTGLEIDAASCQKVRNRLQGKGEVIEGDAHSLPFPDGAYSAIIALEVLEHLTDYRKAVRQIHRCLTPAGQVIVSVPYRRRGGKSDTNEFHLYEPGERELVQEFQKHFATVEVQYQYFRETPLMTAARIFHFRRFVGLAGIYGDLWRGVPSAVEKIKIDSEGKGFRITLMLIASNRKANV